MPDNRVGGTVYLTIDGTRYAARGEFSCNEGGPVAESVTDQNAAHGYLEKASVASIEGALTAYNDVDLTKVKRARNATVVCEMNNGRIFSLTNAWFVGEGTLNASQGEFPIRFEASSGKYDR